MKYKYYRQYSLKICINIWYFLQAENFTQKPLTQEVYHSGHSDTIFLSVTLNIHMIYKNISNKTCNLNKNHILNNVPILCVVYNQTIRGGIKFNII